MSSKYFRGYSTSQLLSLSSSDIMKLSENELRTLVSKLASTSNKRIGRIKKSERYSPALHEAGEIRFGAKGKDYNELLSEYMREKTFLTDPTSSLTGLKTFERSMYKVANDVYGIKLDRDTFSALITDYYKLLEYDAEYQAQKLRYGYLYQSQTVESRQELKSVSDRLVEILSRYNSPGGMGYDGVSEFFEI